VFQLSLITIKLNLLTKNCSTTCQSRPRPRPRPTRWRRGAKTVAT